MRAGNQAAHRVARWDFGIMADDEQRPDELSAWILGLGSEVFVWGWRAGTDGQLGIGVLEDRHSPQPVRLPSLPEDAGDPSKSNSEKDLAPSHSRSLPAASIIQIACGGAHAVALTGGGKVFSWGRGSHGQLGHEKPKNYCKPTFIKHMMGFNVANVSAGWNHSGFVTDKGFLLTCGDGSYGQLGHGPSSDALYSFGSAKHGQLGIALNGSSRLYNTPQIISELNGIEVASIHANGDHSASLLKNGQLYIWGKSFTGRVNYCLPHKIESDLKFNQIALGWNHAVALTDKGELYMLGGYRHGRLSGMEQELELRNSSDEAMTLSILRRIVHLGEEKVVHIDAGAEHSAAVTEKGEIMTWGWEEHGQLGLGDCLDQTQPQLVNLPGKPSKAPSDLYRFRVYCGSGFTFAVKSSIRK